MLHSIFLAASVALSLGLAGAQSVPTCSQDSKCPSDTPCCSAYGQCGVGAYCLGGCDPRSSFQLDSCMPRPTCKSSDYKLDSLSDVAANTIYLGDSSNTNWVSEGTPVVYNDDSILLTMAQDTSGTLLSSTHYVWYGKIATTMKSSRGQGVVTAFVMMSDVKDEIDYEFVGADNQAVQSNFYWQGVTNYTNSANLTAANTDQEEHVYELDWSPDRLIWSVDGVAQRTLEKDATFNSTTNAYQYPQTPARIQLSLWPAGTNKNPEGTVEWAGGLIDWNSPYMANGYYYAQVMDVSVECYDPPSGTDESGDVSYVYGDYSGLQNTVSITNDGTILDSFYANGENPKYNPEAKQSASGTGSVSLPTATNVQTVPGVVGSGNRGNTGTDGSSGSSGSGSGGSGSGSGSGAGGSTTFSQGTDDTTNTASNGKTERAMQGSAFAVLIAVIALVVI